MLIATHVVSDVECIAKEILLLRSGKLLEKETPEKLVEQMEGLVWEVIIRPDQLDQLEQVLLVSNVNIAKEGFVDYCCIVSLIWMVVLFIKGT